LARVKKSGRGQIVNRAEVADLFGVAEATVDQWIRRGMPVVQRGAKGIAWKINSADVSDWLRQRDLEQATGEDAADEQELKRRKLAAETSKSELELLKLKGDVVPLHQVERALAMVLAEVKVGMRNIPQRTATMLIGEQNETRIKEVLLTEVDQTLEAMANMNFEEPDGDD